MTIFARFGIVTTAVLVALAASSFTSGSVLAGDKEAVVLTAEEKAEKESRKACKIQICNVFRSKKASGETIACHIKKSLREKAIKEMVTGGKIGWRWGKMFCEFDLSLKQADLASAVNEAEYELKLAPHTINCKVDRKKDNKWHKIAVGIEPVVKFKGGKAVEGRMNWGSVEAPLLFKSLIWPGIKIDNQVNVIGGKMVKMMNGFMTKKCDQVAGELSAVQ
ncbi:MAG: hypothetical protein L3J67_04865 [Hyphomicrobiaceae bacterium]|nr:hypothetical protein [Hyphomicrobiaceae bacterium]